MESLRINSRPPAAALLVGLLALPLYAEAQSQTEEFDMAGMQTRELNDGLWQLDTNYKRQYIETGSVVIGASYSGLIFESFSPSWQSEAWLAVGTGGNAYAYTAFPANVEAPGTFEGSGEFLYGSPFEVDANGAIFLSALEQYDDPNLSPDAQFTAGVIAVQYVPGNEIATIDPDAFSHGQDISNAFAGVSLSIVNGSNYDSSVYSATSSLASTGAHTFAARLSADGTIHPDSWSSGSVELPVLRIDFDDPTDLVLVDFIGNDSDGDVGFLQAYSSQGELLESFYEYPSGVGDVVSLGMSRETTDIAYIQISGFDISGAGSDTLAIDNLRYHAVPEPTSLALLGLGGMALLRRRRH